MGRGRQELQGGVSNHAYRNQWSRNWRSPYLLLVIARERTAKGNRLYGHVRKYIKSSSKNKAVSQQFSF